MKGGFSFESSTTVEGWSLVKIHLTPFPTINSLSDNMILSVDSTELAMRSSSYGSLVVRPISVYILSRDSIGEQLVVTSFGVG